MLMRGWIVGLLVAGLVVVGTLGFLSRSQARLSDLDEAEPAELGATGVATSVLQGASEMLTAQPQSWQAPSAEEVAASLQGLEFQSFVDTSYREYMLRFPQMVTIHGLAGLWDVRNDGLDSYDPAYAAETRAIETMILEHLRTFSRASLSAQDQLTFDACEAFWSGRVAAQAIAGRNYLVTQSYVASPDWRLYDLMEAYHPHATIEDVEDYLSRLSQVETQIDQLIAALGEREQQGIIAPKPVLTRTRELLMIMGYTQIEVHPFFFDLAMMAVGNAAIPDKIQRLMLSDGAYLIDTSVRPAYRRLLGKIAELEKIASDTVGVDATQLDDVYEYALHQLAETELTGAEVHAWARDEMIRVQNEIIQEAAALWHTEPVSFEVTVRRIAAESQATEGSDLLMAFSYQLDKARNLFRLAFSGAAPSVVQPVTVSAMVTAYRPASFDGARQAKLAIPQGTGLPSYLVATRVYHETIPGLYLFDEAQRDPTRPLLLQAEACPAVRLGWAAYAERLAWELGAYDSDPYGNFGRLVEELKRAALVAVDTGIHALGWTYAEAMDFYVQNTWDSEENARTNVLETIAAPGSCLPAFVGFETILNMRDRAQQALGDAFDLPSFHALLLGHGYLSLRALEALID